MSSSLGLQYYKPGLGYERHITDKFGDCSFPQVQLKRVNYMMNMRPWPPSFSSSFFYPECFFFFIKDTKNLLFEPLSVVVTVSLSLMLKSLCTSSNISVGTSFVWLSLMLQQALEQICKVLCFIQWTIIGSFVV